MAKLTRKQKAFVDKYLASDKPAYEIYQDVYKCRESTAHTNASKTLSSANVQEYIRNQDRKNITRGANVAIKKLIELIDSDDPNVVFRAAKELAYMGGYKPKEQIEHGGEMIVQFVGAPEGLFDDSNDADTE